MKNLLKMIAFAILLTALYNCTSEPLSNSDLDQLIIENIDASADANNCIGDNPAARITNNGSVPVDLDIFDENGVLLGFVHNLAPVNVSNWISFPPGNNILFAVSNDTYEDEKVIYDMTTCMIFDMEFESNNSLSNQTPETL